MPIVEIGATVTAESKGGVKAQLTEDKSATVNYDMPDTVKGCLDKFGEAVVFSLIDSAVTLDVQALIRRHLLTGKTQKQIQEAVDTYKPGIATKGKSKVDKAGDLFDKMSPEERKAFLSMVKSKAAGK